MARVFITDAMQRKSLPIVRSLGRKGIQVIAGDYKRLSLTFFSKYCSKSVIYPSPIHYPETFAEWMIDHVKRNKYDVIFPIDEWTLMVITKYRDELSKYTSVPIVDHATFLKARNKAETLKIALDLGIPCPKTYFIKATNEVKELAEKISFPVVIKPKESSGSRGLVYVHNKNQLYPAYCKIHEKFSLPLIQEYIPSEGGSLGVEALFNHKFQPKAIFMHRRLREFPIDGGPSTLSESTYDSSIIELGIKILKKLNWIGVAMVEFKIDSRDKKPKLMEINPKFWGSIQLAISSGVDFPYLLYKMAIEGDVVPVYNYKLGIKCRWLIPGDILHFIKNPERFKLKPSFFKFRDDNLKYDILSSDDLGPILGMFLFFMKSVFNKDFWVNNIFR